VRVLLTGSKGQAGTAVSLSTPEWAELICCDHRTLDITEEGSVRGMLRDLKPEWIINAAAYTDVDRAETESRAAYEVNAEGTATLAAIAKETGTRLVHISTDFVFNGCSPEPMTPDRPADPLNVYGKSKREGEVRIRKELGEDGLVLRTSWLYFEDGRNFVKTMLHLMQSQTVINVVDDQIGAPTWAGSLANTIWACIAKELSGTYHWRDAGTASWYDFAVAINDIAADIGLIDQTVDVQPISTADYPTAAERPRFVLLNISATEDALGIRARHWTCNLREMLERLKATEIDA